MDIDKKTVENIFKELEEMSQEDFDKLLEKHANGPFTQALLEAWNEIEHSRFEN